MDLSARTDGDPGESFAPADPFLLSSTQSSVIGWGARRTWRTPLGFGLAGEIARGLADVESGTPAVAVGAVPFDPLQEANLVLPERLVRLEGPVDLLPMIGQRQPTRGPSTPHEWRVFDHPALSEYETAVRRALDRMIPRGSAELLRKVVLARSLVAETNGPILLGPLLDSLRSDPAASVFCVPLPGKPGGGRRVLVGASPELLMSKKGRAVLTVPLAGSRSRSADRKQDRSAAEALQRSEKDLREHATVVEWILDRLGPHCKRVRLSTGPSLISTSSMWHLGTRISGELKDPDVSSLELLASIHPTPAVCGLPIGAAFEAIRELELFDRGFFAGAVGWCDSTGDGEWMLAIRCAEVEETRARLYAGAGIVLGSDPASEAGETSAKFRTMLDALGVAKEAGSVRRSLR